MNKEKIGEVDKCYATVIKIGNSIGVVIPYRSVKFSGLKEGDQLVVYYKKIEGD